MILLILSTLFIHYTYSFDLPKLFPFNKKDALGEWEEKVFKNKVLYLVEPIKEGGYLLAKSTESCSGLFYKIKFHPRELPMISWQWKVLKFPEKETIDGTKKGWIEKDDYAGRVYVIFPSWIFTHTKSIEYIWDESLPEGTILSSPYFHNIKLIVAQSGREKIGKWIFEEHNIYEDYNKAFGTFPSDYVGAIALMTDTDNTLSTAETLYKDIKVGYKK
ncbi:MAG: DUF3047 domain-containing protein [Candidatus Omnitrophota bacterium]